MAQVTFNYKNAGVADHEVEYMKKLVLDAKEQLVAKTGAGNDFLGWIDLPVDYDKDEFNRIKEAAKKIQNDSDVLLVIGIGGSYLGARAVIEAVRHSFYNNQPDRKTPEIYYCTAFAMGCASAHEFSPIGFYDSFKSLNDIASPILGNSTDTNATANVTSVDAPGDNSSWWDNILILILIAALIVLVIL